MQIAFDVRADWNVNQNIRSRFSFESRDELERSMTNPRWINESKDQRLRRNDNLFNRLRTITAPNFHFGSVFMIINPRCKSLGRSFAHFDENEFCKIGFQYLKRRPQFFFICVTNETASRSCKKL